MNYYDALALGYNELHKQEQLSKINLVLPYLRKVLPPQALLLDVGCGTGFSLDILSKELNCVSVGLEPSAKMLAQYTGSCKKVCSKVESIPFEDNSFDCVVSFTAVQNFDDVEQGIDQIHRVVKKNGPIIISCLKKSAKLKEVSASVSEHFIVHKLIEEEKDIIFFCTNQPGPK